MKKLVGTLAAAGLIGTAAHAESLTVTNSEIEMSGGITAGYFWNNNTTNRKDFFSVPTFAIDLSSKESAPIGFTGGIGISKHPTILDTNPNDNQFKIEYAWLTVKPTDNFKLEAGHLLTNIGYELFHTYDNQNFLYGLVWNAQPLDYPAVRATYTILEGIDVYAEYNQDTAGSAGGVNPSDAYAVGSIGSIGDVSYAISYYDYNGTKNLLDFVLSGTFSNVETGINIDYQWLDKTAKDKIKNSGASNVDSSAIGIAMYISPKISDTLKLPIRVEFIKDGESKAQNGNVIDSGIYGVAGKSALTFTVSPTWKPNDKSYVRVEASYAKTDKKQEEFDKKNNRTFLGLEIGYIF